MNKKLIISIAVLVVVLIIIVSLGQNKSTSTESATALQVPRFDFTPAQLGATKEYIESEQKKYVELSKGCPIASAKKLMDVVGKGPATPAQFDASSSTEKIGVTLALIGFVDPCPKAVTNENKSEYMKYFNDVLTSPESTEMQKYAAFNFFTVVSNNESTQAIVDWSRSLKVDGTAWIYDALTRIRDESSLNVLTTTISTHPKFENEKNYEAIVTSKKVWCAAREGVCK